MEIKISAFDYIVPFTNQIAFIVCVMGGCTSSSLTTLIQCDNAPKRTFNGVTQLVKLVDVYDGDTIKIITRLTEQEQLAMYSLRVYGIDTPELRTRNELEKRAAQSAKTSAVQFLSTSPLVWIEFMQEDKYGRLMGKVYSTRKNTHVCGPSTYVKHKSLADHLLQRQQAKPYFGKTKVGWTTQEYQTCIGHKM